MAEAGGLGSDGVWRTGGNGEVGDDGVERTLFRLVWALDLSK